MGLHLQWSNCGAAEALPEKNLPPRHPEQMFSATHTNFKRNYGFGLGAADIDEVSGSAGSLVVLGDDEANWLREVGNLIRVRRAERPTVSSTKSGMIFPMWLTPWPFVRSEAS